MPRDTKRNPFHPMTDADVGRACREKFGDNPFGIKPYIPPRPKALCAEKGCTHVYNFQTMEDEGICSGHCL